MSEAFPEKLLHILWDCRPFMMYQNGSLGIRNRYLYGHGGLHWRILESICQIGVEDLCNPFGISKDGHSLLRGRKQEDDRALWHGSLLTGYGFFEEYVQITGVHQEMVLFCLYT